MVGMKPVTSSNISAIGYDPESKDLVIQFKGGGKYRYEGVPATAYADLIGADSIGGHFHKHIRAEYAFSKHDESE